MVLLKKWAAATMLVSAIAIAGTLVGPQPATGAGSAPVTVVNTPLPVAIQGNVSGSFTGAVSVTNAAGNPVLVRDVDNPARRPFQHQFCGTETTAGAIGAACDATFSIPAEKVLVVEHMSGQCLTPTGKSIVRLGFRLWTDGSFADHEMVPTFVGTDYLGTPDHFSFSQALRLYADSSGTNEFFFVTNDTTAHTSCDATVSGYLVDR